MTDTDTRPAPQVTKDHYLSPDYVSPARFASYAYQLREVLALEPHRVLEVGAGSGLVSYLLRRAGVDVTTLDLNAELQPDLVASVTDMPVTDASFDVVACFEVLEHLPFGLVPAALGELARASSGHVLISLPDVDHVASVELRLPGLGTRRLMASCGRLRHRDRPFTAEHLWEIGRGGMALATVLDRMEEAGLTVTRTYRAWEMAWHRFFILRKNGGTDHA